MDDHRVYGKISVKMRRLIIEQDARGFAKTISDNLSLNKKIIRKLESFLQRYRIDHRIMRSKGHLPKVLVDEHLARNGREKIVS